MRLLLLPLMVAAGISPVTAGGRYFAEGLTVEAELQNEDGKLHLVVTRYDESQESHQILYGDLTDEGGGKYRLVNESADDDGKTHTLTGTVKIADGSLSYADLKDSGGKLDGPASGGPWKEINGAAVLRNARTRYESADKLLNAAWTQARAELGAKDFPELQESQRRWIKYRDSLSERIALNMHGDGGEKTSAKSLPDYWQQMTAFTVSRTPLLRAWSGKNVPPGRSGIYRDSFGGDLTLEEKKDGLHFEMNVVRTAAFNLGEISGTAKLEGETATWTDAPKPEGEKPAKLTFKFNANRSITIESENADAYHGAHAHFDGQYFKVAPLKKEEGKKPGE
ncbi:MAG TPA: lysozyme inhibitor LprI family protein [Verrucomicrobiales bacterium]|nr:lysozyme inhibitor LprI family protein [Verrucomicrobiales bacterium]